MENTTALDYGAGSLQMSSSIRQSLQNTAKWGTLLSIIGFIFIGLMVISGVFIASSMSTLSSELGTFGGSFGVLFGVGYLVSAALSFYPTYLLFKFSNGIKKSLREEDQLQLESAMNYLSNLYTFWGILTIVLIAIYVISIIAGVILGFSSF